MKVKTIITCPDAGNKTKRWCMQCGLHVDEDGKIDLDFYTARQYIKFLSNRIQNCCSHEQERPDSKEELLKKVDEAFAAFTTGISIYEKQRNLLKEIIRRLP